MLRTNSVRSLIAITVLGVFMAITAFMAIFPLLSKGNVELNIYADYFSKTASVYTGIVGVIVGYYFGRREDPQATKPTTPEGPSSPPAP